MPLFHTASAYVATAKPHRRNVAFGVTGTVFVFCLLGLLGVEGFRLFSRQAEKRVKPSVKRAQGSPPG